MLSKLRAEALASELDIGLDCGICLACLSFVSMELDSPPRTLTGALVSWTRTLWLDGLAEPARAAVAAAAEAGIPDAEAALADLDERGPNTRIARAIVLRLAWELDREARAQVRLHTLARARLGLAPPELN